MINRQYVFDVEVWENGQCVRWASMTRTVRSLFAPNAKQFINESQNFVAKEYETASGNIRIKGVFKL